MTVLSDDVGRIARHVARTIGVPAAWAKWPGGWPGDIEAALVDAIFSARAVYRSRWGRGVHADIQRWRDGRARSSPSLAALLTEIDSLGPLGWADKFGSKQVSPGRSELAPGGALKAATVRQAAAGLIAQGISTDGQITTSNVAEIKRSLRSVPGIGYATTNYFLMLLGLPGVKPDRMVHRFLNKAAGHGFTDSEADRVVAAVAQQLNVETYELDHAIWRYESARASR